MPDTAEPTFTASEPRWKRRSYTMALLVMATATLGSSWCGYQSTLWNGKQTFKLADANGFSRKADVKSTTATQLRALDAALFVEYARNLSQGRSQAAQFIFDRMRPEMREAMKAWLSTRPLTNPDAPLTPFTMPPYRIQAEQEAQELSARAADARNAAQQANMNSISYTMLAVFLTAALFLAGLVGGLDHRGVRQAVLALALTVIALACILLVRLPVAHRG
jgi:hypothetical protein